MLAIVTFSICMLTGKTVAQAQEQTATTNADHAVDKFIERKMDEAGIMGLGVAIIIDKKVVWMKGYGFADKERAVPFTPETVMNIASISKTFTGVAIMRAVEEGKLSLDEDINTYLPFRIINPYYPNEKITLRQLATHTSGITDRWSVYKDTYHYGEETPKPLGEFLKSYFVPDGMLYSKDNFLDVKPGTHREYSNIAAGLAGYIVELAVGENLNVYTKRHIFDPLQMGNSGWFMSENDRSRQSKSYVVQYGLTIPISLYEGTNYPDGGVHTSVSNLSKFFIALLNDGEYEGVRILEKESAEEMIRFQYTESNKPYNVNLKGDDLVNSGIFWATKMNATRVGHNGTDPGVRTWMLSDVAREVGVILFANTSLSGEERRHDIAIFQELWKHADALKNEQ